MSLIGALNIGKNALAAQQAALQVTGNNIANAGNADYTRQVAGLTPGADQKLGTALFGSGVDLTEIQRQVDESLLSRIRGSVSDNNAAQTTQQWAGRVESVFGELTDAGLSNSMGVFFNSWSNLANKPHDSGLRQAVIQAGTSLARRFNQISGDLQSLNSDVFTSLSGQVQAANKLAQQVADLNGQISQAEGGGRGVANGLRDQRDAVLKQLSGMVDITTVNQGNGSLNVYVGSSLLVQGTQNRGLELKQDTINGKIQQRLIFSADHSNVPATSGQLGALIDA
jgi:flagellar hook-associated protein 1 FlgK